MSSSPPQVVADRYRLVAPLGQGGMGRVWRATDVVLHRDVAIKELVPPPGLTPAERQEMRERSLREARAIARLNNINVVRVFDVLRTDADPWIVMEYVASRSLQDTLAADGPYNPVRAAEIGLGVLNALRAAHRAGVVHRDVKPGNVLIGADGRVVLTDFGLATVPGDPNVTRTGLVLGSPAYIAPERARDGTAGPAADLWSLGATLFAAVEGASPFARPSAIATLAALATENPPPARNAGPLKPVLNGLLRKDPTHRINAEEAERLLLRATGRRSKLTFPMSPTMRRPGVGRERPALPGNQPTGAAPVVPGPRPPIARPATPPGRPSVSGGRPAAGEGRPPVFVPGKAPVGRPSDTPTKVDGPKIDATRVDSPGFSGTRDRSPKAPARPAASDNELSRTSRGDQFTAADVAAHRRRKAAPEHEKSLADATALLSNIEAPVAEQAVDATTLVGPAVPPVEATTLVSPAAPADATTLVSPAAPPPDATTVVPPPVPSAEATSVVRPPAKPASFSPAEATSVVSPPVEATSVVSPAAPAEATSVVRPAPAAEATSVVSPAGEAASVSSAAPVGEAASVVGPADSAAGVSSLGGAPADGASAAESTGDAGKGSGEKAATSAPARKAAQRKSRKKGAGTSVAKTVPPVAGLGKDDAAVAGSAASAGTVDGDETGVENKTGEAAQIGVVAGDGGAETAAAGTKDDALATPKSETGNAAPVKAEPGEEAGSTAAEAKSAAKSEAAAATPAEPAAPTTESKTGPAETEAESASAETEPAATSSEAGAIKAEPTATSSEPEAIKAEPTDTKTEATRPAAPESEASESAATRSDVAATTAMPTEAATARRARRGTPAADPTMVALPVEPVDDDPPITGLNRPNRPAWRPMEIRPPASTTSGVTVFGTRLTYRQAAIGAGIVVLVLVLIIVLVAQAFGDDEKQGAQQRQPTPAATTATSPPAKPSPSATSAPSSAPPSSAAPGAVTLPDGWEMYTDSTGFKVPLPKGASKQRSGSQIEFKWNYRLLLIDQTNDPKADTLADWQQQEKDRAGRDYRNYQKIKMVRVNGYFEQAADWEFLYNTKSSNNRQHAVKRNIIVNDEQAYSISWYVSPEDWDASQADLKLIYQGFQPKK